MLTVNTTFQPQMLKIQMTFWHSGLKLHITTEDILLTLNLINNKRNCIFLITCMSFRISLKTKLSRESCDTLYKTSSGYFQSFINWKIFSLKYRFCEPFKIIFFSIVLQCWLCIEMSWIVIWWLFLLTAT